MNRIDFIKAAFLSIFVGGSALKGFKKKPHIRGGTPYNYKFPKEVVFRSGFDWVEPKTITIKSRQCGFSQYHAEFLKQTRGHQIPWTAGKTIHYFPHNRYKT